MITIPPMKLSCRRSLTWTWSGLYIQLLTYRGKRKKIQRLEKHVQWHHGNTVSKIQIVDKWVISFLFFLALPQNLRDLSSPTRDPTHAPCKRKCGIIHSGPSGKFLAVLLFKIFIYFYFCLQLVFVPEVWLSLVLENKVYSSLQCMGFSLQWLLLLWCTGFSSWSTGIKSCGKRA